MRTPTEASSKYRMRVAFIIAYEKSPYAGVVRPFINWAKELKRHSIESTLILIKSQGVREYLEAEDLDYQSADNKQELRKLLKKDDFDYVFLDDHIKRLKMINVVKEFSKSVVYAQVLYGSHAISPVFVPISIKDKVRELLFKFIPFTFPRYRYIKPISKASIVLANSETTRTLLYTLYGIITDNVVYPPLDTRIFKPCINVKENQVVIYLGSFADTDPEIVKKVCKILNDKGFKVMTLGNPGIAKVLRKECSFEHISGVSDYELAKIYSRSMATIAPQKWEQFGYVVAESIACGTPVIAFNVMGPAEIIRNTDMGLLANSEIEFLNFVKFIEKYIDGFHKKSAYMSFNSSPFSIENSTRDLLSALSQIRN